MTPIWFYDRRFTVWQRDHWVRQRSGHLRHMPQFEGVFGKAWWWRIWWMRRRGWRLVRIGMSKAEYRERFKRRR